MDRRWCWHRPAGQASASTWLNSHQAGSTRHVPIFTGVFLQSIVNAHAYQNHAVALRAFIIGLQLNSRVFFSPCATRGSQSVSHSGALVGACQPSWGGQCVDHHVCYGIATDQHMSVECSRPRGKRYIFLGAGHMKWTQCEAMAQSTHRRLPLQ
eukprot:6309175-Amphidinium_carterae.1